MTAQNLTSVIMVTYHTGAVLDSAIKAVLAQTAEVELILVNNGNPPDVEESLIARFKDDPSVRLMTGHGNVGLVKGFNLGARVASGSHLLFLSPRCLMKPDTVAALLTQAALLKDHWVLGARLLDEKNREQKGSRSGFLSPKSIMIEILGLYKKYPKRRLYLHHDPVPQKTVAVPSISNRFMFMKKEDYVWGKGFDEHYVNHIADMDFCFRFGLTGGHVYFEPRVNVVLAAQGAQKTDPAVAKEELRGLIYYCHENLSDKYFQPLLWAFYGLFWLRAQFKSGFRL